jgi:hypothetical protein
LTRDDEPAPIISDSDNDDEEICINGVSVSSISKNKIAIPITNVVNLKVAETKTLIDCGAEGKFVDKSLVDWRKVKTSKKPIPVKNVDGTLNKSGSLRHKVLVQYDIKNRRFKDWFYVTELGDQKMILGLPWLRVANPQIDWNLGTVEFADPGEDSDSEISTRESIINEINEPWTDDDEETMEYIHLIQREEELDNELDEDLETDHLWIQAKTSASQALAHEHETKAKVELPNEYVKWKRVFDKEASQRFPTE